MKRLFVSILLLALAACGKDNGYKHLGSGYETLTEAFSYSLVEGEAKVDIIWVIDNSGSMQPIQSKVIANAANFMQEFIKQKNLNWKMALLSTDVDEQPYLGFASVFDYQSPDPVTTFQNAVSKLGTYGSGYEKSLDPVVKQLKAFPTFLRPQAHLIMIMVSDEVEQSDLSSAQFLAEIKRLKPSAVTLFKAYGAFNAYEFGCNQGTLFDYKGSKYEEVINATQGSVYSTCAVDFGAQLAKLGNNIVSAVTSPVILLKQVPQTSTIEISYKGELLPGGLESLGGKWIYDPTINGIRFHNLDFVDFIYTDVQVTFEVAHGE